MGVLFFFLFFFSFFCGEHRKGLFLVVAELQEALETCARMLGAHALVAVRKEHDEAALAAPLGLARGDELVDDALSRVGKVTKLRLPAHCPAPRGNPLDT